MGELMRSVGIAKKPQRKLQARVRGRDTFPHGCAAPTPPCTPALTSASMHAGGC